jgi:DNA-binding Lrp family transcriptional regulator
MDSRKTDISLLKILQKDPTITQRGIAAEVGLSLGKVNYCLKKLAEKGRVKTNKKSYSYLLTTKRIKEKEYQQIKQEIIMLKRRSLVAKIYIAGHKGMSK